MRNFTFILLAFCFWACAGNEIKMQEAKTTAETAINFIGNEKFNELAKYYSLDFGNSEPLEERNRKFSKICEITGPSQNMVLVDSLIENNIGEESRVTLTYKVTHANITSIQTYKIGKESENYVICGIDILIEN